MLELPHPPLVAQAIPVDDHCADVLTPLAGRWFHWSTTCWQPSPNGFAPPLRESHGKAGRVKKAWRRTESESVGSRRS